jgi:hypothetical protein
MLRQKRKAKRCELWELVPEARQECIDEWSEGGGVVHQLNTL